MQLIQPLDVHLLEMMTWFPSEDKLVIWSGPNFRYPFNSKSFIEDLNIKKLNSFCLVSNKHDLLAFGQYYQRLGRCHLGRLVVSPKFRGRGVASVLMQHLSELGLKALNVKECSLFVFSHNQNAIKAYEKFGFKFSEYPDEMPLENCLYMVKP